MSIAGGYYKAADAAAEHGMDVVQIFTRNTNQWKAKPLTPEEAQQFSDACARHGLRHPIAHASYLINLASSDTELRRKSVDAMVLELERADALGLEGVVVHPGASMGNSEQQGLELIVAALDEVCERLPDGRAKILLENTAGQGTCLGWRFEHLGFMLERAAQPQRLGVCLDTCHAFAAGYGLATAREYRETMDELDKHVGIERVRAWHVNDSKRERGSRVDRHDHIGCGKLGLEPFWRLLRDSRWRHVPKYLETNKGERNGETYDARNLLVLQTLARQRSFASVPAAIDAIGGLVQEA